jgi:hypothetical protein
LSGSRTVGLAHCVWLKFHQLPIMIPSNVHPIGLRDKQICRCSRPKRTREVIPKVHDKFASWATKLAHLVGE